MAPRTSRTARTPVADNATPGNSNGAEQESVQSTSSVNDGSVQDLSGVSQDAIDPDSAVESSGDSGRKRRRDSGTRRGPRTRRASKEEQNPEDIAIVLLSIHMMLSNMMKVPEMELTPEEATKLAVAINRVNSAYSGIVIPEKVMVWVNLVITAGGIYGPRVFAYNARQNKDGKTISAETLQ